MIIFSNVALSELSHIDIDKDLFNFYLKAAKRGNTQAQYIVGLNYLHGNVVIQHYGEAEKWIRKSAEQGNNLAQNKLGSFYLFSKGGLQEDYVLAHMWLNIASLSGNSSYGESRDYVAGLMNPKQISLAQDKAKICLESNYRNCK